MVAIEFFIPTHPKRVTNRKAKVYQVGVDGRWTWHHGECAKKIAGSDWDALGTTYGEYHDTQPAAFRAAMEHMKERHV